MKPKIWSLNRQQLNFIVMPETERKTAKLSISYIRDPTGLLTMLFQKERHGPFRDIHTCTLSSHPKSSLAIPVPSF